MPHEDPVVVVVQVIASKDIKLPSHGSHGMVDPPLQHRATAYPLILKEEIQVNSVKRPHGRQQLCLISSGDRNVCQAHSISMLITFERYGLLA